MKKCITASLFILILSGAAFALNDREYYDMKKDPFFRAADKRLIKFLEELKPVMPDKDFEALSQSQKRWLAVSRDLEAEDFIRNNNTAKVDAYVQSTEGRIKYLEGVKKKYVREPEPEPEKIIAESKPETQSQTQTQPKPQEQPRKNLTRRQAQELLERELRERGLWSRESVIVFDDQDEDDGIFTLYDDENNTSEECWHFVHGSDYPDYVSAVNDYYVSMSSGAIYVLDTFDDVVRPIDEAEI